MSEAVVNVYLGCCGSVSKKLKPWEEAWDASDYELYKCSKCGREDFYDGFLKMELENKNLPCPVCQTITKQSLESYDQWNGLVKTKCSKCKKIISHGEE